LVIQNFFVNEQIRFPEVRVIDSDGKQLGVMKPVEALQKAKDQELDLVLVAPEAKPPVCKITNFGHFKYEVIKKEKDSKKSSRTKSGLVKELKMSLKIGAHDYEVRKRAAEKFLEKGYKVKVVVQFRGREVTHPEVGEALMKRFCDDVAPVAEVEMGRMGHGMNTLISMLSPKRSQKPVKDHPQVGGKTLVYSTEKEVKNA
jgi:translation initiation factor IF-3